MQNGADSLTIARGIRTPPPTHAPPVILSGRGLPLPHNIGGRIVMRPYLQPPAPKGPLEKGAPPEGRWGFLTASEAPCNQREETLRHGLRRATSLFKGGFAVTDVPSRIGRIVMRPYALLCHFVGAAPCGGPPLPAVSLRIPSIHPR